MNTFFFLVLRFVLLSFFVLPLGVQAKSLSEDSRAALSPVTVQLNWLHQFEFAGFYPF